MGETPHSLFWPGSESPLESSSSEMSLSEGAVVNRESNLIKTPNKEIDEEDGTPCSIKFLQGGGANSCGDIVAGGARFCMVRSGECTPASHARLEGLTEELPEGNYEVWVFMEKPSPHLPAYDLFQPNLGAYRAAKSLGFESLPMKRYSLQRWESTFRVIESEASKNPILSPERIRRANGEYLKPSHQHLPLVENTPENIRAEDGTVMTIWLRAWYNRDQDDKRIMRGHLETSFNDLLNNKAEIGRENKDGER